MHAGQDEKDRLIREYELIFNSLSDAIVIIDKDHNILDVNHALLKLLDTSKEMVVGRKCYEVMHKMSYPFLNCPMEMVRDGHQSHTSEIFDPRLGMTLLITSSPVFDAGGGFKGVIEEIKDITALKKTEEELRKRMTMLEKFQKLTVDRELKMKEMKQEIASLKEKAGK